jgi:hypothetical protein
MSHLPDMGRDLIEYPVFADALRRVDDVYAGLGCTWSIFSKTIVSLNLLSMD